MITELRTDLIAELNAIGVEVTDTWETEIVPPMAMVVCPQSGFYVNAGKLSRDIEVHLDVIVVVKRSEAATELSDIDTIIENVITDTSWAFQGADPVGLIGLTGEKFPATIIHLAIQRYLGA